VEGEGNVESFKATQEELKRVIAYADTRPEFPFAVFKCTGIGAFSMLQEVSTNSNGRESDQYKAFYNRFEELCSLAHQNKVKLLVDAEESWIQKAIDDVTYEMMERFNREEAYIFNTIQMYRTTRVEEINSQIKRAKEKGYKLGFKLVRGAYMEKERERAEEKGYTSPIQIDKQSTDTDYNKAVQLCFEHRDMVEVMAGSHNEESAYLLTKLIQENGIEPSDKRFWFAQLYGMSDHISFNLAKAGFNVAKYLPYGPVKEVLPYLSRRAKENSSVKGQAGRELNLINKEIKRRKREKAVD
jgi:proline dehydrogenase